ncbi:MAG TPA: hypothetical protein VHA30_04610, partial [Patescibacteria group bacterium]|nr:hypothetical protein [Patescibacteria group bacterium]
MSRLQQVDFAILSFIKKYHLRLARAALFLVYFWFGALKLFGASPANPLVASLLERTLPFLSFQQFIVVFALFEMLIGILFLLPGWERLLGLLLAVHLLTTFLPLLLLPAVTWQGFLVPTLEGQYIIKNVL